MLFNDYLINKKIIEMIVFLILLFFPSVILNNEDKKDQFIPPALQFDDSIYFNRGCKSNIVFIDYQQLILYDLCYDGKKQYTGNNNETIYLCNGEDSIIEFNNSKKKYTNFNVSFGNETPVKSVKLTFGEGNESLILFCNNNTANIIDDEHTKYIQSESDIVICGRKLIFQYILYEQCGIFGYYLIFFGLFNLVYGYQNKRFIFSFYSIFVLIRIAGEIIDEICSYQKIDSNTFVIVMLIICFVLGSVFGCVLSPKFEFQKAILSFLVGDILFNFIFIGISVPLGLIAKNEYKILLLVSCIIITFLMVFFFIKDEVKCEKIINVLISAAGSFLLLVGVKYICGGIPLEQGLLLFQKSTKKYTKTEDDINILNNMKKWYYFFGFGITFLVLWLIGIIISIVKSESKNEFDSENPSDEEGTFSEKEK